MWNGKITFRAKFLIGTIMMFSWTAEIPLASALYIVPPNDTWQGGTSDWTYLGNWSNGVPATSLPSSQAIAINPIGTGGTSAEPIINTNSEWFIASLLQYAGSSVTQSTGELSVQQYVEVGYGNSESSTYSLSGGTLFVSGVGTTPAELNIVGGSSFVQTGNSVVYLDGSNSVLSIAADSTIWGNTTYNYGSGIYTLDANNSSYGLVCNEIDVGNSTVSSSEAVFNYQAGALETNSIVLTNGGTFEVSGGLADIAAAFTVNGGNIYLPTGNGLQIDGVVSGGSVTLSGGGELVLTGDNLFTGGITVDAGATLLLANTGALGTGAPTIKSGATLDLGGQTILNGITVNGTGVDGAGAIINSSGNAATWESNFVLGSNTTVGGVGNITISGPIHGNYTLTKTGSSYLTLSGTNSTYFTGDIEVNGGGVVVTAEDNLGTGSTLTLNGGVLEVDGSGFTMSQDVLLGVGGGGLLVPSGVLTVDGGISGSGVLEIGGDGTSGDGTIVLDATNSYTGGTSILFGGTLQLANDNALPSNSSINLGESLNNTSGTLDMNGYSPTVSQLTTTGSGTDNVVTNTSAASPSTLIFAGGTGPSSTFGGTIQDGPSKSVGLTVSSGTLILTGTNTYTGTTTVNGATLQFSGSGTISSSSTMAIANVAGATLDLNGTSQTIASLNGGGSTGGTVSLGSGGSLTVGDSTTETFAGAITYSSTGTFTKQGSGSLTLNNIRVPTVNISAGTLAIAAKGTAAATSVVKSLTIASGATIDLSNNALVVDYDGASPAATIRTDLSNAYDGGSWDDPGIGSSAVANQTASSVGYAEASDVLGISGSQTATFAGQTVDATSILVMFTWEGDVNLDGVVDSTDLSSMSANPTYNAVWSMGDFNYNGEVNGDDYALFELGYLFQTGSLMPMNISASQFLSEREAEFNGESTARIRSQIAADLGWTATITSLPEPGTSAGIVGISILAFWRRQRVE